MNIADPKYLEYLRDLPSSYLLDLFCGFPIPVGFVDLQTGNEILPAKVLLILRMALNALVGVSLTLFPVTFIYSMID